MFIDAIDVNIRDGQIANRLIYAAIGVAAKVLVVLRVSARAARDRTVATAHRPPGGWL